MPGTQVLHVALMRLLKCEVSRAVDRHVVSLLIDLQCFYKQFPGKPAAEVSYKKLTYRSVHVLSNMRVLQSNARAPDF